MSKNPYFKYKETQVLSASREQILLLMYEAAIKFTKLAIKSAEEGKIVERCTNLGRAFDIVMELNNTLDHSIGGEISINLERLYMFITDQYTKANLTGDPEPLRISLKILETLYDGWKQAVQQLKKDGLHTTATSNKNATEKQEE
ncbi:MAG: flagellar export chaperone FliS [Bdellovibrionaceae bacterium]|nr:flagellar export chaperone FliS [Pseudobdellovibrionaceae bacterium]MDW8191174.1 flagellar export chaperone FliS [Pseudobdellovibrionaceae bacterium]